MKKLLLGTSALVAVGLTSADALAQGYLGLGGYWRNWAMIADYPSRARINSTAPREFWMTSNSEIYFRGETKLNNGLTFGFRVELEAWSQTAAGSLATHDQIDETWGYVKGAFGEIRFGEEDDVRKLKGYSTYIGGLLGVDSPDAVYALGTNTTYFNTENDAPKIIYFSPVFGGFSFGVSYAPDQTHGTRSFAGQGRNDCDGTQSRGCNGESWSIAADYRGKFGDVTVGFDAGYTHSNNEVSTSPDLSAWRADGFANISGMWEFGAWYGKGKNYNGSGRDNTTFGLGILYNMGNWQLGGIYGNGEQQRSTGVTDKRNHWVLGAAYNLGGGVQVLGSVNYQRWRNTTGLTANSTGTTITGGGNVSATTLVLGIAANL
jgi:predicted porin